MQKKSLLSIWVFLIWAISLASCSHNDEASVKRVLEARRLGLEKKDIALYMSSISPQYGREKGAVERLRRQAIQTMRGCDSIQMRIEDRRILISGGRAEALQAYEIRIQRGEQLRVMKGQERISLEKEAVGWKITSGL